MATDGVKIIDGDLARDIYGQIMDLYDSDTTIETIRREIPFILQDYGPDTDFYHEIFVTVYALAFWEIGELSEDVLAEVRRVRELKAGVKVWTEECGESEGNERQKELDKLLRKISQPNLKVRKRKKFRLIEHLFFQPDDVLAFKLSNDRYHAVVCVEVTQKRGQCTYDLVPTTYNAKTKPLVGELTSCYIPGCLIGSGSDLQTTLSYQPHVDEIWSYTGKENFFFGLSYTFVNHKDMISLKDKFDVIGKLKVRESFKRVGSYGYETSFEGFERVFGDLERQFEIFGFQKYPVTLLCEV